MKRIAIVVVSVLVVTALVLGASMAMAAKPQKSGSGKDVIALSNGFPSGPHETLNIHGKKDGYQCEKCDPVPGEVQCNVINIPEEGTAKISYVSGRKVKIDELTVFDSCAGWEGEDDRAEVWLPYEPEGYWVFARATGKPAKGDPNEVGYEPRRIIFQNEEGSPVAFSLFGEVTNPDDVPLVFPLGVITKDGAYKVMSTDELGEYLLVRFDSEPAGKGRGKNVGKDITDMFMWSGWVFHGSLDLNGDLSVNELDVEYACWSDYDDNENGIIEDSELIAHGITDTDSDEEYRDDLALVDPCVYDLDDNGVIDASEFDNWLSLNQVGWVFPLGLDLNGDGVVDHLDVVYDCIYNECGGVDCCKYDLDENDVIDPWDGSYDEADEFENWLEDKILGDQTEADFYITLWEHYETPVWVFTIADLVYHNQVVINEGIKNLQIRFYPVATTEFEPKNRIIVDKVTDPPGSEQSFDFTLDGPGGYHDAFSLTDGASPYTSIHLQPGEYTVTETVPSGWDLPDIVPDDGNSTGNPGTATATINLEAGERVTVTFTNTEQS